MIAGLVVVCGSSSSAIAFDGAFKPIEGGAFDISEGPVPFVLEPGGSADIDGNGDLDALRAAFRAWECVPGTSLRFVEGDGPGPADANLEDGLNTLFWDESNEFGLGPGTLGVTVGDVAGGNRAAADIVFNGFDHQWSVDDGPSATDIGSIAVHEIGHFIGLDHPCDVAGGQETNCNGADRSIMTPAWDGLVGRNPLPDDEDGVRSLYPADDDSRCDGPFGRGEVCACDGECVDGLVCATPPGGGTAVCADTCSSDDSDCGNGFACVLDLPEGDDPAPGICVRARAGERPAGAVCVNGGECADGRACALLFDLSRSLCQAPCDLDSDCGDLGRCFEGFCLGGASHEACEEPEPPGCTCSSSSTNPTALLLIAVLAVLRALRGGRREHGATTCMRAAGKAAPTRGPTSGASVAT